MKVNLAKVKKAKETLDKLDGVFFCDECGETAPSHGFYPLYHSPSLSGVTCNPCRRSDKDFLATFGHTKQKCTEKCIP